MKKVECQLCEGDGGTYYSCCGDELGPDPDSDFCPQCGEHCGEGDFEKCEHCNGLGHYFESEDVEEVEEALAKQAQIIADSEEEDIKLQELGILKQSNPPRNMPDKSVYINSNDGMLWQLNGSSWTPMQGQNNLSRLPKSYLVTKSSCIGMKNPCAEIGLDHDIDLRRINPISPEQAYWMQEQEGKMMYGGMPSSSTKVVHVDWKSIEKQTGLKFLNTDHNAPTNSNTNEQRKDYSIFDS